jgi:hypothetical protein
MKKDSLHELLKKKLKCSLEGLTIDEASERIYVEDVVRFHALLQQHRIKRISTGGGYHFILELPEHTTQYWKITLALAENKAFESKYASHYMTRYRKKMPGAFF